MSKSFIKLFNIKKNDISYSVLFFSADLDFVPKNSQGM